MVDEGLFVKIKHKRGKFYSLENTENFFVGDPLPLILNENDNWE